MLETKLKLAPPWITYVNELKAMFESDPTIKIVYSNEDIAVKIYIEDVNKAEAISFLLPEEVVYGNVTLFIYVIPANNDWADSTFDPCAATYKEIFDTAFKDNPVYAYSTEVTGVFSNVLTYVVFKNKVVQFFNDNLNDIHGLISTLYQDIADELFQDDEYDLYGVHFCTDVEEKVWMMPKQWP